MSYICAITNQKGGVGKTTTTINLAVALGEKGQRVLMVDLDPQAGLTVSLGYNPDELSNTIYQLFLDESSIHDITLETRFSSVSFIPSNLDLAGAEVELIREIGWDQLLISELKQLSQYDFILLDCPPSLGLLTVNALVAARSVIVPVETQFLAFRALKSLRDLVNTVKERSNPKINLRILRTKFEKRTIQAREISYELEKLFPTELFETIIPKRQDFTESSYSSESILTYASDSDGARAFRLLANELIHDKKT